MKYKYDIFRNCHGKKKYLMKDVIQLMVKSVTYEQNHQKSPL